MWSVMRASSHGLVEELDVDPPRHGRRYVSLSNNSCSSYEIGVDVFEKRDDAVVAAKVKLAKRIASLQRTLARVQTFEVI